MIDAYLTDSVNLITVTRDEYKTETGRTSAPTACLIVEEVRMVRDQNTGREVSSLGSVKMISKPPPGSIIEIDGEEKIILALRRIRVWGHTAGFEVYHT